MKAEYKKNHAITYTEVNQNAQLSLVDSFNLVQNVMTEYFESIESDNLRLKTNNKAIWVVSKTKIHFENHPIWRDMMYGRGYTTKVKPIRVETETTFRNKDNDIVFTARQESCPIDLETRKIRKVSTVDYPKDMETEESVNKNSYLKLTEKFTPEELIYRQKVYSTDIDYSKHTNNVSYVKYIMNTFPCKFFDENTVTDFEIHHINETREGQKLDIYKKEKEDNKIEFLITEGEREVARAGLKYKKII